MKILLVGEYSRLHNSLKEGLMTLGHQVTIIGCGDYFKNYPVDIKFIRPYQSGVMKYLKNLIYRLTGFDWASWHIKNQFFNRAQDFKNYDVVQLINESPLGIAPRDEAAIVGYLRQYNPLLFVLSCGTDYISVRYAMDQKFRYSILTPLFENKVTAKDYAPILKYMEPQFVALHHKVMSWTDGVIATDLDYHIPMMGQEKYLGLIPNPINTDLLQDNATVKEDNKEQETQNDLVTIFHGINTKNYFKKGSDYFEQALKEIQKKYADQVRIITTRDVPYHDYITAYSQADIILDQVLGYDQGYNALEAMAQGKIVFTGAEQEWLDHYQLAPDTVAINAMPDAEAIAQKLSWLIDNPEVRRTIAQKARLFIEESHQYQNIAKQYLNAWQQKEN